MEKTKKILLRLLYPHGVIVGLLAILAAAGLIYVFAGGLEDTFISYVVYMFSFYALCVLVAAMPAVVKRCRALIYGNTHAARYLTERELRTRISLYTGTVINVVYAVFKLVTGIVFRSVWFGAVAVYYMVMGLIRFLLVKGDRKIGRLVSEENRILTEWTSYHICGWLLLALNATMTGMVFQMVWQNKSYSYPGFIIYASAAYTFYRLTMAIIQMVKIRKDNNPLFSAAKALDLSVALMAIFALQTAMFTSFGAETSETLRQTMNAATGGTVCLAVVCIAVYMIVRSGIAIRTIKVNQKQKNNGETG